jgi:hypothetical protein
MTLTQDFHMRKWRATNSLANATHYYPVAEDVDWYQRTTCYSRQKLLSWTQHGIDLASVENDMPI